MSVMCMCYSVQCCVYVLWSVVLWSVVLSLCVMVCNVMCYVCSVMDMCYVYLVACICVMCVQCHMYVYVLCVCSVMCMCRCVCYVGVVLFVCSVMCMCMWVQCYLQRYVYYHECVVNDHTSYVAVHHSRHEDIHYNFNHFEFIDLTVKYV